MTRPRRSRYGFRGFLTILASSRTAFSRSTAFAASGHTAGASSLGVAVGMAGEKVGLPRRLGVFGCIV